MFKKLTAALLSMALLAGATAMPAAAAESYSLGDINMNGKVDTMDAIEALYAYLKAFILNGESHLTAEQQAAADISADGVVDTVDAYFILYYYVYTLSEEKPISLEQYRAEGRLPTMVYLEVREPSLTYPESSD